MQNQTETTRLQDFISLLGASDLFSSGLDVELRRIVGDMLYGTDGGWYQRLECLAYFDGCDMASIADVGYFDILPDGPNAHKGLVLAKSTRRLKVGEPSRHTGRYLTYYVDCQHESVKLGRILKAAWPNVADHEIAILVDVYKSRYDTRCQFDIVTGEDIRHWYHEDRYHTDGSTYSLAQSCMRHGRCQDYLDIYVQNPDVCSLVIATRGGMLVGRALLWTDEMGGKYLDRRYGTDDTCQAIREYVRSVYPDAKTGQTYGVSLTSWDFSQYPYMDTFEYLDMESGTLQTERPDGHYRTLQHTDGGYYEYIPIYCEACGNPCDDDRGYRVDGEQYCWSCWENLERCYDCGESLTDCQIHWLTPDGDEFEDAEPTAFCGGCAENALYCFQCDRWYLGDLSGHVSAYHMIHGPWESVQGPMMPTDLVYAYAQSIGNWQAESDWYTAYRFTFADARRFAVRDAANR